MSTTFERVLREEADGMSVRSLAQVFHDADRASEGLPGADLARALASRVERARWTRCPRTTSSGRFGGW